MREKEANESNSIQRNEIPKRKNGKIGESKRGKRKDVYTNFTVVRKFNNNNNSLSPTVSSKQSRIKFAVMFM